MSDVQFGLAIRVARESVGVKQYELADRAGMIRTNLTRLENGTPKNPGMATRVKLASALGMTVEEVMDIGRAYADSHPTVSDVEIDSSASALRLKRLIDVVDWNATRENEISEKLWDYAREDARRRSQ